MNDIIAGDPAPTNPVDATRADILAGLRMAEDASIVDESPEELLARYDALKRVEILAEAADAVDAGKLAFPAEVRGGASWAARMLRRMADPEPWIPNGGHQDSCGYVGGVTARCTCGGAR